MQRFLHIVLSLLVIIVFIVQFNYKEFSFQSLLFRVVGLLVVLLIVNLCIWVIRFIVEKIFNWLEKKKNENYSLLEWLGETNISLELFKDLSEIKAFNRENFHENYLTTKLKIKEHYKTDYQLKGLKNYLELQTGSQKFSLILNSTQTILIAIIIPTVLALLNFKNLSSIGSSINAIIFLVFWLILLYAIEFISKQIDRIKVLHRLVSECINENQNVNEAD